LHVCDVFAVTVSAFIRTAPITKKEIAKETGVNISSVFRWQNETTHPDGLPLHRLVKLARRLGHQIRPADIELGYRRCKDLRSQKSA
jgi:hypothetical protein